MSNLESRITKLEELVAQRARQQAERNEMCGPIIFKPHAGGCVYIPCDRVLKGLVEFAAAQRHRDTCPDVVACEFSEVCRVGVPS